jgi:hypothetical protein
MKQAELVLVLLLTACARPSAPDKDRGAVTNSSAGKALGTTTSAANAREARSPAREALQEPGGPIDPKSTEAAGQIVQSYGALIEQGRWSEANALWRDKADASKFQSALAQAAEIHLEIGNLGEPGGAAGSIYVSMPVIFFGDTKDGQPFRRFAEVILRRVNDVPGSTEAQRRWHIERIDWTEAP